MLIDFSQDETKVLRTLLEGKVLEGTTALKTDPDVVMDETFVRGRVAVLDMIKKVNEAIEVPSTRDRGKH